jgi:hypothetical protein
MPVTYLLDGTPVAGFTITIAPKMNFLPMLKK